MPQPEPTDINSFIDKWKSSEAAERANFPQFAVALCDILGVERPSPTQANSNQNAYVFEKAVPLPKGTTGRIDLYKRGHFVLEAKQGSDKPDSQPTFSKKAETRRRRWGTAVRGTKSWDTAMEKARQQAQRYARNLPADEIVNGRPPFLIIIDVGNEIRLYSEFSRSGGSYTPFPDPNSYRIRMDDLRDDAVRQLLRTVWTEPMTLDPSLRSARVTREIADRLARLARSLEGAHEPELVAQFLMRTLFTMFAEDINLLPARSFSTLLADIGNAPDQFKPMLEHLWQTMNTGGFSVILRQDLPQFNGGLFADQTALPLNADQIQLLVEAAQADWRDVEPAIFGTLLERALDPIERHKLGAHYTPRAYVERLVQPTVIEPLRAEWESVQAAALELTERDESEKAIREVEAFHKKLASIRILDPACGSGNFLYVTLELLKRLEGEVLNTLRDLGQGQMLLDLESVTVSPQQFLGIEVNPRAAAIAELVLWIGYLQWHVRTRGKAQPPEPIIKNYRNIENRDAVLAWDAIEPLLDKDGQPVTRWDGRSTKPHSITGEQVPDDTARVQAYKYINPRPAEWPDADYIVGNPPFIGTARMREALGDGYTETVRKLYKNVPNSADFVMFWWDKAATLLRDGKLERFGLITTNSLRQTFNRRVLQHHMEAKKPLSLVFAIPDHPWVDSADGAAVRIAMTVAEAGEQIGQLQQVIFEDNAETDHAVVKLSTKIGKIQSDLTIGANVAAARTLTANENLSNRGMMLFGSGFIVNQKQAKKLGLGQISGIEKVILSYRNGRDLTATPRNVLVIDLYGYQPEEVKSKYPEVYQWILERVKPDRDQNRDKKIRENWWLHGRPRPELRDALNGLNRYIATVETSKHRFFVFLDKSILPDNKLVNIALEDAYFLGVLSSRVHVTWALAAGGRLGVGNDPVYVKSKCFETFPFPDTSDTQKARIRELAERLDGHRKRQQAQHPKLTLTDMYNVLEKVRTLDTPAVGTQHAASLPDDQPLTAKEKKIYDDGLIAILRQLHDELDAAVFDAYGWPPESSDEEILEKLVALNAERAAEEAQGHIRWLRPEYQAPDAAPQPTQATLLPNDAPTPVPTPTEKVAWPDNLREQATAVRQALAGVETAVTAKEVAGLFKGRRTQSRIARILGLLETLADLGQVVELEDGRFTAV